MDVFGFGEKEEIVNLVKNGNFMELIEKEEIVNLV